MEDKGIQQAKQKKQGRKKYKKPALKKHTQLYRIGIGD